MIWANDNEHIFYIRKDKSLRAFQVYRHKLRTDPSEDILIFHEKDDTFDVNVFKTKSLQYIFIASSSTISDEHHFIPADNVFADWKVIQPRIDDLEYSVEHYEDEFYIITNADGATNFKIVKTKIDNCGMENWVDVIPHRAEVLLEGFEIFKDYLVLEEREKGCYKLRLLMKKLRNLIIFLSLILLIQLILGSTWNLTLKFSDMVTLLLPNQALRTNTI